MRFSNLENKINLILISAVAIVLTAAFWMITDIESANFKKQIQDEADVIIDLIRGDVDRMFHQMGAQRDSLQYLVDKMSGIAGVEYIQVFDTGGYFAAATQHDLIGTKAEQRDLDFLKKIIESRQIIDDIEDEKTFFKLERYFPVKLNVSDENSEVINVIEIEVETKSKNPQDVRDATNLLQMISAGLEQNARSVILTRNDDLKTLQDMTDNVVKLGFFHDIFVFNPDLNAVAATGKDYDEPARDSDEHKKIKEEIISGKTNNASYESVIDEEHGGHDVIVRLNPIYSIDQEGNSKIAGLVEVHILADAFENKINALRLRMVMVAAVIIITLASILILLLRKGVVAPLKEYATIAQKVAAGDLNQRIENISSDEIGKFGEVFNLMVANLRELDKLKSEFISVAAHQLRTPLSAVKWATKMVLDGDAGPISDEQKNLLDQGYKSNERMIALINDLLDVSRIEAGKFEYEFVSGQIEELIETTIQEFQQIVKHKSVDLKYNKPANALPKIKMDSIKLKMVVENLIDNAIKYTAPAGKVEASLKLNKDKNTIEMIVSDTGVGIPKDQIPQLFSKFFRAKNVIRMQTDGTGLGLFIAKKIIEKHNGNIWAESEEGKGTQIHFTLPIA